MRLLSPGVVAKNFPLYSNILFPGTVIRIDRACTESYCSIEDGFLTFSQKCDAVGLEALGAYSGYMTLTGVSSVGKTTRAFVEILANYGSGAVGPWTANEVKHFGVCAYQTDADNNYILMISPAASAAGERGLQLVKQVAGLETVLGGKVVPGLALNTKYIMDLSKTAGVVTGVLYDNDLNFIDSISVADASLTTGESGGHGFSAHYKLSRFDIF